MIVESRLRDVVEHAYAVARRDVFDCDRVPDTALTTSQLKVLVELESAEQDLREHRAATAAGPPWPQPRR